MKSAPGVPLFPSTAAVPVTGGAPTQGHFLPDLESGSVAEKVLAEAWSGSAMTLVLSPPGAGKTHLSTIVCSHLATRAKLTVAVACTTNAQALAFAARQGSMTNACPVTLLSKANASRPAALPKDVEYCNKPKDLSEGPQIVIATAAKWEYIDPTMFTADVLLVDEAYQLAYRGLLGIAPIARQFILVGDPGQIGPVITADVSRWQNQRIAPMLPAPEALLRAYGDAVSVFQLPSTRRLGPVSAQLVQPFYENMTFCSDRPERFVSLDGERIDEVLPVEVGGIQSEVDPRLVDAIAARVHELLAGTVTDDNGEERPMEVGDVAVVCAHVSQVAAVQSALSGYDIAVDTADRVQGLEWEAVVVWDPLAGQPALGEFQATPGRLCVMLSRHRCHVTFVTGDRTADAVIAGVKDNPALKPHMGVRQAMGLVA
jgi:hypothetical protein